MDDFFDALLLISVIAFIYGGIVGASVSSRILRWLGALLGPTIALFGLMWMEEGSEVPVSGLIVGFLAYQSFAAFTLTLCAVLGMVIGAATKRRMLKRFG